MRSAEASGGGGCNTIATALTCCTVPLDPERAGEFPSRTDHHMGEELSLSSIGADRVAGTSQLAQRRVKGGPHVRWPTALERQPYESGLFGLPDCDGL